MHCRTYFILFFLFTVSSKVNGQMISINLKASDTSISKIPSRPINDTSLIAHIPFKNYSRWSLRKIVYYNLQATYENLPDNPTRKKMFKEFVERYQLDTSYLTKQKIPENYIYLFTAIDSAGNKHVIIDANNNHDFKDDREYVFSNRNNPMPVFNANIKYYDGQVIRNAVVPLKIDAFNTFFPDDHYKSDLEKNLDVMINILLINKTGNIVVNNQDFKVNIIGYDDLHPKSGFEINIQKIPFDKKNNNDYRYKSSDTLEMAGSLYKVISLKSNTLSVYYVGKSVSNNAETGTVAPYITTTDIRTNALFALTAQKGKYVLIDFWGSWCVPCINLIPEVRELHEKYKNEIQFVSVAYDRLEDTAKVQKLISENKMNWVQLLDNRNLKMGIVNQYKVNEFPTSILIAPSGKVIYRGIGGNGLKKLIEFYNLKSRSSN